VRIEARLNTQAKYHGPSANTDWFFVHIADYLFRQEVTNLHAKNGVPIQYLSQTLDY